jgi:hypothetical protein
MRSCWNRPELQRQWRGARERLARERIQPSSDAVHAEKGKAWQRRLAEDALFQEALDGKRS